MGKLKFLTREQKEFYTQNGFVKLSGVFSNEEFEEIAQEYDELFQRKQNEDKDGLEAAWVGNDMKKAARNINYTVSRYRVKFSLVIFIYTGYQLF